MWHFVDPPPIECHVLFEWPQINYFQVTKPDRMKQTPVDMTGNELDFNVKRKKKNQRSDKDLDDHQDRVFFEDDYDAADIDESQVNTETWFEQYFNFN